MTEAASFLGVGLYSVPEAARLTRVSPRRIRGWLSGYENASTPVWQRGVPATDGHILTFLDLIEVRFVNAFRSQGVSWKVIRRSAEEAARLYGSTHPFSTRRFRTDGRRIIADLLLADGNVSLVDLFDNQMEFRKVIEPFLKGLELSGTDEPLRWWPLGVKNHVVIDPARSFGTPITPHGGVPTRIIAAGYKAEGSAVKVARWYGLRVKSVNDALKFERSLQAA